MRRTKKGDSRAPKQDGAKRGGGNSDGSPVRRIKPGKKQSARLPSSVVPDSASARVGKANGGRESGSASSAGGRRPGPVANTWIDYEAAERIRTFSRALKHFKGDHAGRPFELCDWQFNDIILPAYGTKRADGTRQFRELTLAVPRKNGKSPLAAMLGLYHLFADGENYPEVVCAAGSAKQAKEVYDYARFFISGCPLLARRCIVKTDEIVRHDGGKMRLLAADGKLQHGQNLSAVISDELHVWPDEVLYEALRTGVAGRRQPMRINISTAGYDMESKWGEIYTHAKKVIESRKAGKEIDPYLWAAIYEASPTDDWRDEAVWRKANPNFEVSVYRSYFEELMAKAESSNSELNSFLRFNLNMWTSSDVQWLNLDKWDECYQPPETWPDLAGRPCYVGVDLANTTDLAAISLAFPVDDTVYIKSFAWTTRDAIKERERRNKMRFDKWAAQGHLDICDGGVIDFRRIMAKLDDLSKLHTIREIGIDRWGAAQFIQECQHQGLSVVGFGQGFAGISSPTKGFEAAVLGGKLRHDGNPLLRWCVSNVMIESDPAGNIKPSKKKSTEKIDCAVASIMAVARAQLGQSGGVSVYESRGLAVL